MVCVFHPLSIQGETHFAVVTYSLHSHPIKNKTKQKMKLFYFVVFVFRLIHSSHYFAIFHFCLGGFAFYKSNAIFGVFTASKLLWHDLSVNNFGIIIKISPQKHVKFQIIVYNLNEKPENHRKCLIRRTLRIPCPQRIDKELKAIILMKNSIKITDEIELMLKLWCTTITSGIIRSPSKEKSKMNTYWFHIL